MKEAEPSQQIRFKKEETVGRKCPAVLIQEAGDGRLTAD